MSIVCEDIPNTNVVKKALRGNLPSMVYVRYIGESKIPGIDATKLAPSVLPVFYKKIAHEIEALNVYKDDIWVTSFPKCGTTWAQEMVWLITNNLNYDGAKQIRLQDRYSFLELSGLFRDINFVSNKTSVQLVQELPRPRFIKSHLSISLLPTEFWTVKPKLVYVTRNAKDTAISYYHHCVNLAQYRGTLEEFLDSFLNDLTLWSPFREHVLGYWKLRNDPNILFITYDDMSNNLNRVLRKVANFFNKTYTDDQFEQLAKNLAFNEMKKNESVNFEFFIEGIEKQYGEKRADSNFRFFRRGQMNSAKDEMPVEYHKKFDDWLAKSLSEIDFNINT